ncbi:hypothetical protein PEX1_041770 [Penicillium expansum]|uniref:Uncharacterized protein n=1 Tax=Penicillium expansum TaxID=27334 RepID=A0A0A2J5C5_PENEN|nr:hypothetical protein PEX2_090780 [Penicillium expansum]KGO47585.1 hypothetical protein PEXP_014720 [Penicillium expansum]KGO54825.1 hypothetical protein PEX2_090780 [Penicillium expansum]KGO70142.1 hypothetical protein PEX1_041770 [Penicillium expansum]
MDSELGSNLRRRRPDYDLSQEDATSRLTPVIQPFAGRVGGNQGLVLDRSNPENAELLKKVPDAAPLMTLSEGFDLRGLWDIDLWRFGFIECIGKKSS